MELLHDIDAMQTRLVKKWHEQTPETEKKGFLGLVEEQHLQNSLLWHEEDIARATDVSDAEITRVKRSIDGLNQRRNDLIEKLDEAILIWLAKSQIDMPIGAPLNSETPGSMIDRCSIMALKIYHMQEQAERQDASEEHQQKAAEKVKVLNTQRHDLFQCLFQLIEAVQQGTLQFKIYRQFKMYNDPSLNPKLYQAK
ncbi:MAG: hypothetical protein COB67_04860 [SAR324 cluster bacterium]|uniref:DUF4254 domain-containing protein n=1 Tax=SAR324 cluster bacterium TaxID=2024889 RepID=A0A2A4T6S6_9DELT|nr:MAG: hypothetical protein COB67_04860 [SAR324 cluster bacterium]